MESPDEVHQRQSAPVLTTGSHRSGTTWVGSMLCASRELQYVHEPLNPTVVPSWSPGVERPWYQLLEASDWGPIDAAVHLRYPLKANLWMTRSVTERIKATRDYAVSRAAKLQGRRALVKDPFMLFNTVAFTERYGAHAIVTVRNPIAFVGSLTRLNWRFPVESLLSQTGLMNGPLSEWREELTALVDADDPAPPGILLWKIIHAYIASELDDHHRIKVVRHEDLSMNPEQEFERLYDFCQLDMSRPSFEPTFAELTSGPSQDKSTKTMDVRRNSAESIDSWRSQIDRQDALAIFAACEPQSSHFYSDMSI